MATKLETVPQGEVCVESRDARILPSLNDWRECATRAS